MTTQCAPRPADPLQRGHGLSDDRSSRLSDDLLDRLPDEVLLRRLSDDDLLRRTGELTVCSRRTEAALLAHLGEIDARRLYLREACSSMFAWCTERLHFSEYAAFCRITAARAAREHPVILQMLADGRLHMSAVALLAPLLTPANLDAVLSRAVHRSKREVEELVAELKPRPDAPSLIRKLPARVDPLRPATSTVLAPCLAKVDRFDSPVSSQQVAVTPSVPQSQPAPLPTSEPAVPNPTAAVPRRTQATQAPIEPLAPGRFKVQFTASTEQRDRLVQLRALARSTVPDGDLATILDALVIRELARLERLRSAATDRPRKSLAQTAVRPSSRQIPAAVRRAVWRRDGGQCTYRDAQGRRCTARARLEYHHRHPFGYGGDHSVDNVVLLCRAHNRFLEEIDYGTRAGCRSAPVAGTGPGCRSRPVVGRRLARPVGGPQAP